MSKVLCTICMRGGSKGVINKNLYKINSKPLLYYTINQAIKSKLFSHIVVSTDSSIIAKMSKKYGADVFFKRSKKMSNSKSAKMPVIRHAFIQSEKYYKKKFEYIFDLDATSPLRNVKDIIDSFKLIKKEKSNNLISGCIANKSPYFNQIEFKNNKYNLVKKNRVKKIIRRQDSPIVYDMNASIYIWTRKQLLKSDNLFTKKTSLYIMPQERSCDIDTSTDLEFVKYMMKKFK